MTLSQACFFLDCVTTIGFFCVFLDLRSILKGLGRVWEGLERVWGGFGKVLGMKFSSHWRNEGRPADCALRLNKNQSYDQT